LRRKIIFGAAASVFAILVIFVFFRFLKKDAGLVNSAGNSVSVTVLLNEARDDQAKGDLEAARQIYQKLINELPGSGDVVDWQKRLEDLNIKLLFSPAITEKALLYQIKPADTLTKIAKEFKTTVDLIKKSNGLANDKILPGRKIKVWSRPFSIFVDKSQNTLILKVDEEVFKTYTVSTGANNSTPVGVFKITSRIANPTWFKSGAVVPAGSPENILGSRWLGFDLAGYGIHGTTDPEALGKQVTQGCVRLSNPDVEELYTIIPEDTEVTIVD